MNTEHEYYLIAGVDVPADVQFTAVGGEGEPEVAYGGYGPAVHAGGAPYMREHATGGVPHYYRHSRFCACQIESAE